MRYAKAGGFGYILIYRGVWAEQDGHYEINKNNYPNGIEGLKSVVEKFHKEGIKVGIHILVGWIGHSDPYVTPVPDSRIPKDHVRVLARDIDENTDFIPLLTSPEGFPEISKLRDPGGVYVQIDNELITYKQLKKDFPYGLVGCTRGMDGTKSASHVKGAKVYHVVEAYRHFIVDDKTGLMEEIAQRIADVFNHCEMDMIYYDGCNQIRVHGPAWYYTDLLQWEVTKRINREVLIQGGGAHNIGWHIYSRRVSGDYVCHAMNKHVDEFRMKIKYRRAHESFVPFELGWFGIVNHDIDRYATIPEDFEYVLGKCIGYDATISLETKLDALENNGRTEEIFNLIHKKV
jgi:hypothetical protein